MKNKVYKINFKNKNQKGETMLSTPNWLEFCANLKIWGFKKKSKIIYSNLTEAEYETMISDVFPPKKKKNPVEGTLVGIDELIKPFSENKLFAKPPKIDKELSMIEVVSEIENMANEAKIYIIKRQPTFFCKETKVSYNELKKFFTDKAINSMIEDGFIERNYSKYPIEFAEGFNKENAFKPIDFSKIIDKPKSLYLSFYFK